MSPAPVKRLDKVPGLRRAQPCRYRAICDSGPSRLNITASFRTTKISMAAAEASGEASVLGLIWAWVLAAVSVLLSA